MDALTVGSGGPCPTERDLAMGKRVISGEGAYVLTNRSPFGKFNFDAVYQAIFQGMPFRVRRRSSEKSQVRELCNGRPLSRTGRGAVARLIGERGKPTVVQGISLGSFISDRMIQL